MSNKFRVHTDRNKQPQTRYSFYNINRLILEQWPRLTYEEVENYKTNYEQFSQAVQKEYGIPQEEIERQLNLMKREALFAA